MSHWELAVFLLSLSILFMLILVFSLMKKINIMGNKVKELDKKVNDVFGPYDPALASPELPKENANES